MRTIPIVRGSNSRLSVVCIAWLVMFLGREAVAQVDGPPVIQPIADQSTLEGEPILQVPFTVWDAETPANQLRFSTSLIVPNGGVWGDPDRIVIGGTGSNRWFSIYPPPDAAGTAQARIWVTDNAFHTTTASFQVRIQPVNDAPRLIPIPDQIAIRGQGMLAIPFTYYDPDSSAFLVRFRAWSSRQAVIADANIKIGMGNSSTNRILQVTLPANGVVGSAAITVEATDGAATNRHSFVLTVYPPEFERSGQLSVASSTFEPVWGDFNGDGNLDLVTSPSQLWTNRGNGQFALEVFLNSNFQAIGGAVADYDGDGRLDLLLYSDSGAPHLFRNVGPSSTNFVEIPLNSPSSRGRSLWVDLDGDGKLDIVASGSPIRLLRNDGLGGFTGISNNIPTLGSPSLIVPLDFDNDGDSDLFVMPVFTSTSLSTPRLYLNDGSGRFTDSQILFPEGRVRAAGAIDIDGNGLLDLWLVQSPTPSPGRHAIIVLRQERGRFVEAFRVTEPTFTQTPAVPAWADFDNDGSVDFIGPFWPPQPAGTQPTNFPALYRNDGAGGFSTSGIAIGPDFRMPLTSAADFDGDGSTDLLVRSATGALWTLRNGGRAPNSLPGAPSALQSVVAGDTVALFWSDAHDGNQSAPLTYNVRVGSAPGKNDIIASASTGDGVRMMPAPGNAGFNTWMTFRVPLELLDVERLYWSAQAVDNSFQGGPFATEEWLAIDPPGNEPPLITDLSDLTFPEDTTQKLTFFVTDDRSPPETLYVRATPLSTNVFLPSGVTLSGFVKSTNGLRVDLTLVPIANAAGQTVITLSATDRSGLTGTRTIVVEVTPENDPPTLIVESPLLALAGADSPSLPIAAFDRESPTSDLTVSALSMTPSVIPDANISLVRSSTGTGWSLTARPSNAEPATGYIKITARDPQQAEATQVIEVRFQTQLFRQVARQALIGGSWPSALEWADLDGDGRMELIAVGALGPGSRISVVEGGLLPQRGTIGGSPVDFGDIDNDGKVDVLATDLIFDGFNFTPRLVIYRNKGGFVFERYSNAVFDTGVARLTDFDLDGRLDVLVAESSSRIVLHRNNGAGFDPPRVLEFATTNAPVSREVRGMSLVDLDGDGVDELFLQLPSGVPPPAAYRRNEGLLEPVSGEWTRHAVQGVADFNQDQRPDLIVSRWASQAVDTWRNTGALNFGSQDLLFGGGCGSVEVADFDNDGFADVLGQGCGLFCSGPGSEFRANEVPFRNWNLLCGAAADYDLDGMMDFAASVLSYGPTNPLINEIVVFRSEANRSNRSPRTPGNLNAALVDANQVRLSWSHSVDPDQSGGLTYNVRMGSAPGLGDVISPLSLADGRRLLPRVGNAEWNTHRRVTGLQPGRTYYWSVQAVDNSFAGGPFAAEGTLTMPAAIALNSLGNERLELVVTAAPYSVWKLESSCDLALWHDYPDVGGLLSATTNGVNRLEISVTCGQEFFRIQPAR